MTSTATYSTDGNRLVSTTDALGKVTKYGYNEITNVLDWVQYPEDTDGTEGTADTRTKYTYDSMYRMATAACTTDTGKNLSAAYTYTDDYLTAVQTPSTTYSFTYGDFGLRTGVSIGERTLATYNYTDDRNNYLESLDYGNNDSVEYTYDKKGRVTSETYEDGDTVTYKYDNDGALAKVTDSATGRTTTYYYDFTDRLMKQVESGSGYSHAVGYQYDTINNLTQMVETINGVDHTTSYTYDDDNRVESVTTDGVTVEYTYDALGRVTMQDTINDVGSFMRKYLTYTNPAGNTTSSQVATCNISTPNNYSVTYTYTYDDNGNITSISNGTNTTSYVYDSANQLIRENNQEANYTYTWTYDSAGNILNRKKYAYTLESLAEVTPTDTDTYIYGDAHWGDLLTEYDGNDVEYDEIGNLVYDGDWDYTWEHGRQLKSMSAGDTTWTYTYDANGMRTKRTNGTTTYEYIYNGSQLTQMTVDGYTFNFTYDANGTPLTISLGSSVCYYMTNLQGDVIGLFNSDCNLLATYTYDAWGVCPRDEDDPTAFYNPLRYRGYVYDRETGLYYLQSRYYNPRMGRFINADAFTSTGQGLLGNNMFAYCGNNPVIRKDDGGEFWNVVIGAVAGGVFSALGTALSGGSADEIWLSLGCGLLSGAFAATGFGGLIGQIAVGAVTSAVDSGYQNYNDYSSGEKTLKQAIVGTLVDTATGATFGAMGFDGTDALKNSNKIAKNTHRAIKSLVAKTVHPAVKASANAVLRQARKYVISEAKRSIIDNLVLGAINYGIGKTAQLFY